MVRLGRSDVYHVKSFAVDTGKIKPSHLSILIKHPDLASSSAKWAHIFLSFPLSFLWSLLQSRIFSAFYCEIVPRTGQLLPFHEEPSSHPKAMFLSCSGLWTQIPPTVCFTHLALRCWPGPCMLLIAAVTRI